MSNSYELTKLAHFSGRSGPLLLVILDGFGIGKKDEIYEGIGRGVLNISSLPVLVQNLYGRDLNVYILFFDQTIFLK